MSLVSPNVKDEVTGSDSTGNRAGVTDLLSRKEVDGVELCSRINLS